jgi:hypothetical protein
MARFIRVLARKVLGVSRTPTYYLPWLTRPGLECAVLINNIESRFRQGFNQGPFPSTVRQYDADGSLVRHYEVALASSTDTVEVALEPTAAGLGFVTVDVSRIHSDLYVTLSDGEFYAATHGRHEFIERYPIWTRAVMAAIGRPLALAGRTIPAFRREQYVYAGKESRSHLLIMNLSNVTNRIRVVAGEGAGVGERRLLTLPPMGSGLLDASSLGGPAGESVAVTHLHLEGNAWFNLYLVGAGPRDLAGPMSLMHVK